MTKECKSKSSTVVPKTQKADLPFHYQTLSGVQEAGGLQGLHSFYVKLN